MGLAEYKRKRKFGVTPEPDGKEESSDIKDLHFVVQKHSATRDHYDFRLEYDGVLKSWAIPKCPSMDPKKKNLAVMVEDHPYEYRNFEGVIPKGNYGAGPVLIWDEGNYLLVNTKDAKESREKFKKGLEDGKISFILNGSKLRGEFALVELKKSNTKNAWLLIKANDEFASDKDITKEDKSVRSGKKIEEL